MKPGLRLIELYEKINETEGSRVLGKLNNFSLSEYTFQKNNDELVSLLNEYEHNTELALRITNDENTDDFEVFLLEVTRLLHNYLASAKTLIDHTRKLFQDEYKGTKFEEEYNSKIAELFTDSSTSKFIQDLRNYTLHRTLPITGATITFSQSGITHSIEITKKPLMDWSKWTKKALEYLNEQGEKISLLKLINEYTSIVIEFQKWFREKQLIIHRSALEEVTKLQQEYNALCAKIVF